MEDFSFSDSDEEIVETFADSDEPICDDDAYASLEVGE